LVIALHINQLMALGVKKLGALGILGEPGFAEGGLEERHLELAGIDALVKEQRYLGFGVDTLLGCSAATVT
jgi:hypothetical protein